MKINSISNHQNTMFKGKESNKSNSPLNEQISNIQLPDYADEFIPMVTDKQKNFLENLFKSIQKII